MKENDEARTQADELEAKSELEAKAELEAKVEHELPADDALDEALSRAEEELDAAGSNKSDLKDAAARVAMSTVMAGSLAGVLAKPPRTDLMVLPEATPIVQVLEHQQEDEPEPEPEPEPAKEEVWPLRRILKYLVVALALLLAIVVGLARGCASCAAPLLAPGEEQSGESESAEAGEGESEVADSEQNRG